MIEVRELAQHRWQDILISFGVDSCFLNGRNQSCPLCGGKDRFRYTDYQGNGCVICNQCMEPSDCVDGFEFLMRFTGKDFKTLASEIREMLGETTARPAQNADVDKNRRNLRKTWTEAKPLYKGCPTHRYLLNRGLAGLEFGSLTGLRCHPGKTYWHCEDGEMMNLGRHPCMIGLITTPSGEPASIHCTYITEDGRKASLDPVRKIMPVVQSFSGGAVRLQKLRDEQELCVAEGIESALSLKRLHPEVCPWAVMSAGNMEKFVPPNDQTAIYIAGDNDENFVGQAAAFALARRLSGKFKASVLMPKKTGTDWNDQLMMMRGNTSEI